LPELDRYMLYRMTEVFQEVTDAFESYQFFRFFQTIQNFCVVDLSNFYLDIAKDRLYISALDSPRRRSCQTVMAVALENLARAIAPVLCHMAEDIWQYLPYETPYKSVFEAGWVKLEEQWKQHPDLVTGWEGLRKIRTGVNKVLEQARAEKMIGSSLEAKVLIYEPSKRWDKWLQTLNPQDSLGDGNHIDELRYLFLVSQVELTESEEAIEKAPYKSQIVDLGASPTIIMKVGVVKADGEKCDRCWNYSTRVGTISEHPLLCDRCVPALKEEF